MKWIKKRENQIFFSVTLVTILVAISPLVSRYCLLGHDSDYHILRIEALKQQIQMGMPFLKVNPLYFGGMGYASSLFYPDLLLFIPALMRVVGFSINFSYHMFIVVCVILCYTVSYACAKRLTNNRYIGIMCAVILTLSSYYLDDIIVRAAAGEYTAFIFVPLVVYGVYNLCYEDMNKPWILGLGMGLVLLCHTLSFIICVLMVCLMLVFNFDVFLKKPKLILKLAVTAAFTLIATAFYWAPVLEQFMSTTFYVSRPWIQPAQEAVKISSIFGFTFPTLGIALALLLLPRVLIFRNHDDAIMKYADQCITAGLLFAVSASDIMPWNTLGKYFSVVQFPWRLYVVSTVLLSFGAAVVVYRLTGSIVLGTSENPEEYDNETKVITNDMFVNKYGLVLGLVLGMMIFSTIYTYSNNSREYYDYSNDYFNYKPFTESVIGGEWLPISVEDRDTLVELSNHAYDSNGNEVSFSRDKNRILFLSDGSDYTDVPFVYYKGYKAMTDSGESVYVDGTGENGTVRVYSKDIKSNIIVWYKGTVVQKVADIVSVLFILALILSKYIPYTKNKKRVRE